MPSPQRHKKTDMERIYLFIETEYGNLRKLIGNMHCWDVPEILKKNNYEFIRPGGGYEYAQKNGIKWRLYKYSSSYDYKIDGFRCNDDTVSVNSIWNIIERKVEPEILQSITIPDNFPSERTAQNAAMKKKIETIIEQARQDVASCRGWGEIGQRMRTKGYRIYYDGGSVCQFYKDGIAFSAHTNEYPTPGWHLEDHYEAYFPDNTLSTSFSLGKNQYHYPLEHFECIFGDQLTSLGRFKTELERLKEGTLKYDRYLVRHYSNKYLKTLKSFDTFEEAKQFAYETAKQYAESVSPDLRRYARLNPVDCGEENDYLAMYIYYQYRNSKHLLFVQGD